MPEPFMYGVIASILHKIEFWVNYFVKTDEELKTILIKLISDVKAQNYYPHEILGELKKVLYDLDDIIDAEMSENYVADIGKVLLKLRLEIDGRSSFQAYWARFHMAWRSTGGQYLPEKLEWRDAGLGACFAYCALYPKDWVISRENLVNQWMAEGFLLPSGDEELEDTGNRYFNLMLSRGVFQNVRQTGGGVVVSCQMDPLAHDAACHLAGQEVQVLNEDEEAYCSKRRDLEDWRGKYAALLNPIGDNHRLAYDKSRNNALRTFLSFNARTWFHSNTIRVLDLDGLEPMDGVEYLCGSTHLRYLNMRYNNIVDVLSHSEYLQTLVLICSQPLQLQVNRLRHLYLSTQNFEIPSLSIMTSLRILEVSGCPNLMYLSINPMEAVTTTLRILRIFDCPTLVDLGPGMENLPRIEELVFHDCPRLLSLNGNGIDMKQVPNLRRLELIGLDELVELPALIQTATHIQYLMIADCIQLDKITSDVLAKLKSLETLCIYNCPNLWGLQEASIHSLTTLKTLRIRGCPTLKNQVVELISKQWVDFHLSKIKFQPYQIFINFGPYGCHESTTTWRMELHKQDKIKELHIRCGEIVDGIVFIVENARREIITTKCFGGSGGALHKVILKSNEYITHLSGKYGPYWLSGHDICIGSLCIHTNFCKEGYGPFGEGDKGIIVSSIKNFSTPKLREGDFISKIYGSANVYLTSIGMNVVMEEYRDAALLLESTTSHSQTSIFPYFTLKGLMLEKAGHSYVKCDTEIEKSHRIEMKKLYYDLMEETKFNEDEDCKEQLDHFIHLGAAIEELKLFCSLFQDDEYEIEKDTIVQLWMAGGLLERMLEEYNDVNLEKYGSLYFQILEKQDFLLPSTLDKSKYRVNPDKARVLYGKTKPANRYCQLKEENGAVCAPPPSSSSSYVKPWHVSVTLTSDHVDEAALFKTLKEFEGLKTLLLMGSSSLKHVPSDVFTTLKVLRTLDLSGSQISEVPRSIGNLRHLHYLDLSYTLIERLPKSTICLQELQTLKLNGCKHLVELPPGLKKLIRLRHLYFDDLTKVARMPRGLSDLTELQTLSAFIVDIKGSCNIAELASLNNLTGSLCLFGLENAPLYYMGDALLKYKKHLVQLQLKWQPTDTDSCDGDNYRSFIKELEPNACLEELHISCYPCKKLPNWMAYRDVLKKLTHIHLCNCENTEFNTPLGQLPGLKYLEIIQMNRVETFDQCFRGSTNIAYLKLEVLIVDGMMLLESWKNTRRLDFPNLLKLVIKHCPKLTEIPFLHQLDSVQHLEINTTGIHELLLPKTSSLQILKIDHCPGLKEKYSRGGDKWQQIEHVPEIWFDSEDTYTSIAETCSLNDDSSQVESLVNSLVPGSEVSTKDKSLTKNTISGSETEAREEPVPLVLGEEDMNCPVDDCEQENEKLILDCQDVSRDGSLANKTVSSIETEAREELVPLVPSGEDIQRPIDDYQQEKERLNMDGQDGSSDESLVNKINFTGEIEAREELVPADDHEQVNERFIASSEAEASISNIIGYDEMLLYILLFLNEYEFEKEKLIRLWIGAGFLKDEPMEDDGHRVFDSILAKNFIEKASENENDRMYKINSESLSSFIDEVEGSRHFTNKMKNLNVVGLVVNISNEDWDISIRHGEVKQENFEPVLEFSKLRSILFLKGLTFKAVPPNIYSALKNLRILDLSDCNDIKDLSSYVSNAIQLRYLGLSRTKIERLPDSVTDLSELQTLELKGCSCLSHLPMRMNQLTKLRHLEFENFGRLTSMPEGIGALVELRTLLAFKVGSEEGLNIKELKNMNHLSGKICISGLENVTKLEDAKDAALIDKNRLLQLELRWSNNTCVDQRECDYDGVLEGLEPNTSIKELQIICFPGSAFPKWVGDDLYVNLDSITLYKCEDCKSLPALGGLPNLKILEIKEMHGVKEIDDRIPYPALKKLTIDGMRSLEKWSLLNGDIFPTLDELFIKHCPKLETLSRSNNFILSIFGNMIPNNHLLERVGIACKSVEINECPKLKDLPNVLRLDLLEQLTIKDCPFGENYRAGCKGMKKIAENAKVFILP